MDAAYAVHYRDFTAVLPCCNERCALHELIFDPAAGYARYSLAAQNPIEYCLTPAQLDAVGKALGSEVRQIWRHI
jgi:hypothetical protein